MTITDATTQAARKPHRCDWCYERINAGETYTRYRYFNGGDASTVKLHPECYADMQAEATEWGGTLEWTPGEFERPKPVEPSPDRSVPSSRPPPGDAR